MVQKVDMSTYLLYRNLRANGQISFDLQLSKVDSDAHI